MTDTILLMRGIFVAWWSALERLYQRSLCEGFREGRNEGLC
jgi:hypothetical protein